MPSTIAPTLLQRTKQLVEGAPRHITYVQMADATGVTVSWISKLMHGKIENPGVNHVQALHDYLIGLNAG